MLPNFILPVLHWERDGRGHQVFFDNYDAFGAFGIPFLGFLSTDTREY